MALGASHSGIFRMILGDGLRLTAVGGLAGFGGTIALTRVLRSLLFEVQPLDPSTLAAVSCVLGIVCLLACLVPARRAMEAEPAAVLREE